MSQTRAGNYRPVHRHISTIPKDFDEIEEAETECVRQVLAGHVFDASSNAPQIPQGGHWHNKIYSL